MEPSTLLSREGLLTSALKSGHRTTGSRRHCKVKVMLTLGINPKSPAAPYFPDGSRLLSPHSSPSVGPPGPFLLSSAQTESPSQALPQASGCLGSLCRRMRETGAAPSHHLRGQFQFQEDVPLLDVSSAQSHGARKGLHK